MKKIILLLFVTTVNLNLKAQTFVKKYPTNYGSASANIQTTVSNNRIYTAYNEDSLSTPGKQFLSVLKTDLSGAVIWKKQFSLPLTSPAVPVKISSYGANLFVGGNYNGKVFVAKLDTATGTAGYFNNYSSSTFTSGISQINDFVVQNNELMAVGKVSTTSGTTTSNFFYFLRTDAPSGNVINNGISTFYTNQEGKGITYLNNSVYIVGRKDTLPFIAKLRFNGNSVIPVATIIYTAAINAPSSFNQIDCASNATMVCIGNINNYPGKNNFIYRVDTNITNASTLIIGSISNGTASGSFDIENLKVRTNQTFLSGKFDNGIGIGFFNGFNLTNPSQTYSISAGDSKINYYNTFLYHTSIQNGAGGYINTVRADSLGNSLCATSKSVSQNAYTLAGQIGQIGVFTSGTLTPLSPFIYSPGNTVINQCLPSSVKENAGILNYSIIRNGGNYTLTFSEAGQYTYSLIDISGKQLLLETSENTQSLSVDLTNYSIGLYFLKVASKKETSTIKLLNN